MITLIAALTFVACDGGDHFSGLDPQAGKVKVASVVITPDSVSPQVGDSVQLVAKMFDDEGREIDDWPGSNGNSWRAATPPFRWTTSDSTVTTVSDDGVITAKSPGKATVTATFDNRSARAQVVAWAHEDSTTGEGDDSGDGDVIDEGDVTVDTTGVGNPPDEDPDSVASLSLSPGSLDLLVGDSDDLTATAHDADGADLARAPSDFTWSSSNTSVATVSDDGTVTALAAGSASIEASLEGHSKSASVTVSSPTVDVSPWEYPVPGSIAADCSTDATAQLNAFFEDVPDGSTVLFPQGSCYKTVGTVEVTGKSDVVIEGNGARFVRTELTPQSLRYPSRNGFLRIIDGNRVTLRDVVVEATNNGSGYGGSLVDKNGNSRSVDCLTHLSGWGCYTIAFAFEHAVEILGSIDSTVDGVTAKDIWGDGVYVVGRDQFTSQQGNNITVTDLTVDRNGRQGIAVARIQNVLIDGFTLTRGRRAGVDLEPDQGDELIRFVEIRNSTIETNLLAFASYGPGETSDIYIHDNVVTRTGVPWVYVRANDGTRRYNWRVEDNEVQNSLGSPQPGLLFENVMNVIVRGNVNRYSSTYPTDAVGLVNGSTATVTCNWFQNAREVVADRGDGGSATESSNTTGSAAPSGCGG